MCTEKMTDEESRCGRARDEEVYYELRGKFGKSRERTRLTTWRLAHRWVKLTDCSRTSTKLAVREGMHGALHNPTKRLHKSMLALCCKNSSAARGRDCNALRRTISFMGGGAPKKAAGKNEKYKNTQLAAAVLEIKEP